MNSISIDSYNMYRSLRDAEDFILQTEKKTEHTWRTNQMEKQGNKDGATTTQLSDRTAKLTWTQQPKRTDFQRRSL